MVFAMATSPAPPTVTSRVVTPRRAIRSNARAGGTRGVAVSSSTDRDCFPSTSSKVFGTVAAGLVLLASPPCCLAEPGQRPPPVAEMPGGCTLEALDLFRETRAKFSLEVASGALPEAVLDLSRCDYTGFVMDGKVLSGAIASNAKFDDVTFTGGEMSRAKAIGSSFVNANLSSTNFFAVDFAGSDLRNANFDNAIVTNARFGKDKGNNWANLAGVNWEGALLSSSDAQRVCENPTVDEYGKAVLGCR